MSMAAIERKIIGLEGEMLAAVTREDFEQAARLRDQIAQLRGQQAPLIENPEVPAAAAGADGAGHQCAGGRARPKAGGGRRSPT